MATVARPGPFARKSHDALLRDATGDPEHGLKRAVGVLDLTALGIGAVIGTGIFVIIGEAIGDAIDRRRLICRWRVDGIELEGRHRTQRR